MTRASRLRATLRETNALLKQSALLGQGLLPRRVELRDGPDDVVFLLHGFMATAGVFAPLERHLKGAGIRHLASFSYHPFRSVHELGLELKRAVDAIPEHGRLHLVGHSLGGVIARYYVHELGGAARVAQTISMASPFHGASAARRMPSALGLVAPLVREMAPDSALLERLRMSHAPTPHTSIVAGDDTLVTPPISAAFTKGEVVVIDGVGHNGLLFDERAAEAVRRKIRP